MQSKTIKQTISVPLQPGDRVTLLEDVEIEKNGDGGSSASVLFEEYVDRYVPETGLLKFENSDIGKARFEQLLAEADGIEILTDTRGDD